jgi:hypothetical protein
MNHTYEGKSGKTRRLYPALLSRTAQFFRHRVPVGTHTKNGLIFSGCFTGKEAVDAIAHILRSPDRNLAILVGRALQAQRLFHDVVYTSRLRDSPNELYEFTVLPMLTSSMEDELPLHHQRESSGTSSMELADLPLNAIEDVTSGISRNLPPISGFFTLLSTCYSPTCSREHLCYSILCPRRLEQHAYLNIPLLGSSELAKPIAPVEDDEDGRLWVDVVPPSLLISIGEAEVKRQEVIFEMVVSEEAYLDDLELIEKVYISRILKEGYLPRDRCAEFVRHVFGNIIVLRNLSRRLRGALVRRQQEGYVVTSIGDIFLPHVSSLGDPYIAYAQGHPWAKYHLDAELAQNPLLSAFLNQAERLPETRRLPIQSFLSRPLSRIARYPLLLQAIIKRTPPGHPDLINLQSSVAQLRAILTHVNEVAGKSDVSVRLLQLNASIMFKNKEEEEVLQLKYPGREIIREGVLRVRRSAKGKPAASGNDKIDAQVVLFDHALLILRRKEIKGSTSHQRVRYRIHRKVIPLMLLQLENHPMDPSGKDSIGLSSRNSSWIDPETASSPIVELNHSLQIQNRQKEISKAGGTSFHDHAEQLRTVKSDPDFQAFPRQNDYLTQPGSKTLASRMGSNQAVGYSIGRVAQGLNSRNKEAIAVTYLGRESFTETLFARNESEKQQWIDSIVAQVSTLKQKEAPFAMQRLMLPQLPAGIYAMCAAPLLNDSFSHSFAPYCIGTNHGIYLLFPCKTREEGSPAQSQALLTKVIDMDKISQIEILHDHGLVLFISDRHLYSVGINQLLQSNDSGLQKIELKRSLSEYDVGAALALCSPIEESFQALGAPFIALGQTKLKPTKVSSNVTFMKVGVCNESIYVCVVKVASLTSTVKLFEPVVTVKDLSPSHSTTESHKRKPGFLRRFLPIKSGEDKRKEVRESIPNVSLESIFDAKTACKLRLGKEFYVPAEVLAIDFLRTKLCLACGKGSSGFEVVDPETLATQSLLDPLDPEFPYRSRKEQVRPINVFRVLSSILKLPESSESHVFLLCYNEGGFYVDRVGRRVLPSWYIHWQAEPKSFAVVDSSIVVFGVDLIEIRSLSTGEISQVIAASNLTTLHTRSPFLLFSASSWGASAIGSALPAKGNESKANEDAVLASDTRDSMLLFRLLPRRG